MAARDRRASCAHPPRCTRQRMRHRPRGRRCQRAPRRMKPAQRRPVTAASWSSAPRQNPASASRQGSATRDGEAVPQGGRLAGRPHPRASRHDRTSPAVHDIRVAIGPPAADGRRPGTAVRLIMIGAPGAGSGAHSSCSRLPGARVTAAPDPSTQGPPGPATSSRTRSTPDPGAAGVSAALAAGATAATPAGLEPAALGSSRRQGARRRRATR